MTHTLSTGQPSTLGSYHDLCSIAFGPDSPQTRFIEGKIATSPHGRDEPVDADEKQMLHLLVSLDKAAE
jgi:hypothetical protein